MESPYTEFGYIKSTRGYGVFIAASPREPSSVVKFDAETRRFEVVYRPKSPNIESGYVSIPQRIEFPTSNGLKAHAFFYPPQNKDYSSPSGELPPLIVIGHGGPTSATHTALRLQIQYWTSRGFAMLDVNYGGSTGYGREYMLRLRGQWGVVDVDDCVNGALYLAKGGKTDRNRLIMRGGSAGGYTTLCALAFRKVFKAGASHFGLSDLEPFLKDTHKFESKYLVRLIGPYPERRDLYKKRSPINFVDNISAPVIFFQGLDDKIVPPSQAEMMVEVLRKKGLPVAYVAFEGEQHGFRRSESIKRALEAELYFYSKILGFNIADSVEPVEIENLPRKL
jgi:dipeptidyl aminopeptidase/acylaminoacyl peptidase